MTEAYNAQPTAYSLQAHRLALVLPAAGLGSRMGGPVRKPFLEILGQPVLCHTLRRFQGLPGLRQVVVVVHPEDLAYVRSSIWPRLRQLGATHLIPGGERRQDSVACALDVLRADTDIVLIHDAVRPLVPRRAIEESILAAAEHGAAVVAMPVADTIKRADGDSVAETVPRDGLWLAQTPQTFRLGLIRQAFRAAAEQHFEATDDAQLVERLGLPVRLVRGSHENFKITTPEHLHIAEALLARSHQ